jgi:hypothetical protein
MSGTGGAPPLLGGWDACAAGKFAQVCGREWRPRSDIGRALAPKQRGHHGGDVLVMLRLVPGYAPAGCLDGSFKVIHATRIAQECCVPVDLRVAFLVSANLLRIRET